MQARKGPLSTNPTFIGVTFVLFTAAMLVASIVLFGVQARSSVAGSIRPLAEQVDRQEDEIVRLQEQSDQLLHLLGQLQDVVSDLADALKKCECFVDETIRYGRESVERR